MSSQGSLSRAGSVLEKILLIKKACLLTTTVNISLFIKSQN